MGKNKEVLKRHKFWLPILSFLAKPVLLMKYKIKKIVPFNIDRNRQYLFLCNHSLPIDPIFIDMYHKAPIYFVATEQILNLGFASTLLQYFFNLIPISKGVADLTSTKKMLRIKKEGGSIGIFPEGNTEYIGRPNYINPTITKLIRLLELPLVFINSYGLSFCTNRWSIKKKKGKCGYKIRSIIESADYKKISDEALYELIKTNLDVDAYKTQSIEMNKYKGRSRALGLDRLAFICPNCGGIFTTTSSGNYLHCDSCSEDFLLDEYGYLQTPKGKMSLEEVYNKVKIDYLNFLDTNQKEVIFSATGFLMKTRRLKKKKIGVIKITVTNKAFGIEYKQQTYDLPYGEFKMAIQGKRQIILYPQGKDTLLIRFGLDVAPLKFLIAYQYYQNKLQNMDKETLFLQHYGL
jgi:hypothetical protein